MRGVASYQLPVRALALLVHVLRVKGLMFFSLLVMAVQLEVIIYSLDLLQVEGCLQFPLQAGGQLWLPLRVEGEVFSLVSQPPLIFLFWPLVFLEEVLEGEMISLVPPSARPLASLTSLLSSPWASLMSLLLSSLQVSWWVWPENLLY